MDNLDLEIVSCNGTDMCRQTDPLLVEVCRITGDIDRSTCYLEVTLNHPRTVKFMNAVSSKQRDMYELALRRMKCAFGPLKGEVVDKEYEYCKSGHVHLHALIKYTFDTPHYPIGVVADVVKVWLHCLTVKHGRYKEYAMKIYNNGPKYTSPSICCKYDSVEDIDRIEKWRVYMKKNTI